MHTKGQAGIIGSQVKLDDFRICLNVTPLGKKQESLEGINKKKLQNFNSATSLVGLKSPYNFHF